MENGLSDFNMDYKKIFFLYCDDKDEHHILDEVSRLYGQDSSASKNMIIFYDNNRMMPLVPFQITGAAHYEVGNHYYTHRKGLNSFQLIYTCSGHGIVKTLNRKFDCLPGTVMLVNCHEEHTYSVPEGDHWNYKHIHFIPRNGAEGITERAAEIAFVRSKRAEEYLDDILFILHDLNMDSNYFISHYVSGLLTEMIQNAATTLEANPKVELLQRSVQYMREHYMERLRIEELANREFISSFYFIRLFKEYYGIPPYDYLIKYRINQSKVMLLQKKSVKETALQCGFSSINSYSRAFKKYTGISPNQYIVSK